MDADFKQRVLMIVKKIKQGRIKTYQEIAKFVGNKKLARPVANVLAKNRDSNIPCHRVIKNDYGVGGYQGSLKNSWKKLGLLLREGVIAIMPTDTIYGICGTALKQKIVKKIYQLTKKSKNKPMIILISKMDDLKIFGIKISSQNKTILQKLWPGRISVILKYSSERFSYLHRKTRTLAFRIPKNNLLRKILLISGPLVAPSANLEGLKPAETIREAKKYFHNKAVYYDGGKIKGLASTLIELNEKEKIKIIRKGKDLEKLKYFIEMCNC